MLRNNGGSVRDMLVDMLVDMLNELVRSLPSCGFYV